LIEVTELRQQANRLGLKDFNVLGLQAKLQPVNLTDSELVRVSSLYPGTKYLQSAQTLLIGAPRDENFEPLRDTAIIQWAWALLAKVFSNTESSENDKA
jgi:transcription-repair coupling factor (superfamily II helicase)